MPRTLVPRRPPREQVVAGILDAAVALFAKRGYEATTMQDVATKVGMTGPALYYYFDSKQDLLFEVIELNLTRIIDRLDATLAATPAPAGSAAGELAAFVRTHVEFQLATIEGARVYNAMFLGTAALFGALTPRQRTNVIELQDRVLGRLKAILHRGVASGEFAIEDVTVTAMGIMALGEFAPAWFKASGRLAAAQVARLYGAAALRMVGCSG
ncbi:MAG: TetR/AcrR family transcriptional regulator [Gemmatimonadales bacterium]